MFNKPIIKIIIKLTCAYHKAQKHNNKTKDLSVGVLGKKIGSCFHVLNSDNALTVTDNVPPPPPPPHVIFFKGGVYRVGGITKT